MKYQHIKKQSRWFETARMLAALGLSAVKRNICNLVSNLPIELTTRRLEENQGEVYHLYLAASATKVNKRKDKKAS
jgi:hypothetical protein